MSVALQNEFSTDLNRYMSELGQSARAASAVLAYTQPEQKNQALLAIAAVLGQRRDFILLENRKDLDAAADQQISAAMLERLELDSAGIDAMIEGLRQVAGLADPVAEISDFR
jgi:glutamate-5-semialdehyde dehydrogenase